MSPQRSSLEKELRLAQEALQLLQDAVPEKKPLLSPLAGRKSLTEQELMDFRAQSSQTVGLAKRVCAAAKEREEVRAARIRLETEEEALAPWASLDVPLREREQRPRPSLPGRFPASGRRPLSRAGRSRLPSPRRL